MKIIYLFLLIGTLLSNQWVEINSSYPASSKINLKSSNIENTNLEFNLEGFYFDLVNVNGIEYSIINFPGSASNLESGMPDLGHLSSSIIIPNDGLMKFNISEQEFVDFQNVKIAPSKGNLVRTVDPGSVDYYFDDIYMENQFYPENIVEMREPYILRDMRGQAVKICPFQYNPVTQTLRVYTHLEIDVYNDGIGQINVLERDSKNILDKEFKNIYEKQFLNFNNDVRFDYLVDQGSMLIISDVSFLDTMQPLVDWKNIRGIPTEMINVANIGTSSSAITSFVQDYYYDNGLTFLLLVGDIAQMPSPSVSGSSSDVSYGCIEGNDFYPEVIVGRMSGSTPTQIGTQVERSIEYERYPQAGAEWYDNALGVASDQGPGFNGYTDDVFNEFLWDTVLSGFTYDSYEGIYDGSGGTDSQGINAINNGVSLINYTGHGSISSWGNGASLSSSQINALTNDNLLPFVITVGCNVGEFQSTNECFAESWMRATHNGEPTGSIAHFGSTISQSWEPPMHGQYGMNLILTESYDDHLTRSIGGITTNGCMYMNDMQGSSGINETKYWTFFGDPSTNIRTAPPQNMTVVHDDVILIGQEEFVVDVGEDGALVALSGNGELLSSSYSVGGVAILALSEDVVGTPGEVDIVITGFNAFPYESTINVIAPEGAYVVVDDITLNSSSTTDNAVLYGEDIQMFIGISNVGTDGVSDLNFSCLSDDPYMDLITNSGSYSSYIYPGGSASVGPFDFSISYNVPNEHVFQMDCSFASNGDTWESVVSLTAEAPMIVVDSVNGTLNPGQSTMIDVLVSNIGSAAINYPVVLAEGDMYVSVNFAGIGNAYYWDHLDENNQELLQIDVSVSSSTPIGHVVEFDVITTDLDGWYEEVTTFFLPVGQIVEDFENNFSQSLEWTFEGDAEWFTTEEDQNSGTYSAKSGDIEDSQSTSISVTLDVVMDDSIDFYYKVASEYSPSGLYFYDGLEFYIDNQLQSQFAPNEQGQSEWLLASFLVPAGTHTFKWTYAKDSAGGSTDIEADCSWLDDITFPPAAINDEGMLGDINGDGMLSVLDIIQMINMVLGNSNIDMVADVNFDGTVDVLDIILVVNIILEF